MLDYNDQKPLLPLLLDKALCLDGLHIFKRYESTFDPDSKMSVVIV